MTLIVFCALALAGGAGAACRLLVDSIIKHKITSTVPWGTITVNLAGSLLLGLITGLALGQLIPESVHEIIGSGFLGGYTTFSTASFETVRMIQERRVVAGALNGLGVLIATTLLAGVGLWIGALV